MAEQPKSKEPAAPAKDAKDQAAAPRRGLPIKTLIVILAVMVLEAVTIMVAFKVAGKPADVQAEGAAVDEHAEQDKLVEELVVSEKFQNTRTGRTYLYDTEVYITLHEKDQEKVKAVMESMAATIKQDIATIFRRAEPAHLLEPTLATLTRQIQAALDERLGKDAEGKPYVQQVLITKCTQFRADI